VTVALDAGSHSLEYAVEADWHEIGRKGQGVPQLNFCLPLAYVCKGFRYDIPFGTIERDPVLLDVPANSWGMAVPQQAGSPAIQLVTDSTYGFRGFEDALALTLLRSSYDPDPYPEAGIHRLGFSIRVTGKGDRNKELLVSAFDYTHPVDVVTSAGAQPGTGSFFAIEAGTVMVSALKTPEDQPEGSLVVRLYETDGQETLAVLRLPGAVAGAEWVDLHEQTTRVEKPIQIEADRLYLTLGAWQLGTIRVTLA
jgi:alpha-mannosidase